MHVLIEVHHLETTELFRHLLDLLLFIFGRLLDTLGIPASQSMLAIGAE